MGEAGYEEVEHLVGRRNKDEAHFHFEIKRAWLRDGDPGLRLHAVAPAAAAPSQLFLASLSSYTAPISCTYVFLSLFLSFFPGPSSFLGQVCLAVVKSDASSMHF